MRDSTTDALPKRTVAGDDEAERLVGKKSTRRVQDGVQVIVVSERAGVDGLKGVLNMRSGLARSLRRLDSEENSGRVARRRGDTGGDVPAIRLA